MTSDGALEGRRAVSTSAVTERRVVSWETFTRTGEPSGAEFVDGLMIPATGPTHEHQIVCARLVQALQRRVPEGFDAISAWPWKPNENEFVPDVMVHASTDDEVRYTGTPELVVEVLSTHRGDDLVLKLDRYARAGLPRYWILDPRNRVLLAYDADRSDGDSYDLIALVGEREPRELHFGIGTLVVDVSALLA
jgi:Uma2 family endonuclease